MTIAPCIKQAKLKMKVLDSEQVLLQRCRAGEPQAQFQLYSQHAKAMLNVAYRIVNHREDAQDVLQEAFVKAFAKLDRFNATSDFVFWLKRIVVNTAITHLKKNGGLKNLHQAYLQQTDTTSSSDIAYEALQIEQVQKTLMELPDGYRTVLSLYLLEGYDHREIAEILKISVSTSLSQYKRGKDRLLHLIKSNTQYG